MKRIFFKKIIIYLFLTITLSGVLSPNNIVFAQLDFTVTDQGDPNGDGNPSTTTTNTTIVEPVPIYNEKPYEPLAPLPGEILPHFNPDNTLCLYHSAKEWTPAMYLAETIVPWASEWLFHYEIWKGTGEWRGGGI
jgi:hypothetical protein